MTLRTKPTQRTAQPTSCRSGHTESDDLVQPADRGPVPGVTKGLQLVVPGLAQELVDLDLERRVTQRSLDHGRLEPVLRDHDVAVDAGHGVEDAEVRGVG